MYVRNKTEAPFRERQGLKTQILLQLGDVEATDLCVTWVEVEPFAQQALHRHDPEQVYVIVAGRGRMRIGDETRDVTAGDLIHVPPDVPHGISNPQDTALSYISAATPTFSQIAFYDAGNL